jgi:hypothetical protein
VPYIGRSSARSGGYGNHASEAEEGIRVMPKRRALVVAVSWVALAGCATEEELRREDEATCTSYGFQRSTTEFSQCLQRERIARRYGYGYGPYLID